MLQRFPVSWTAYLPAVTIAIVAKAVKSQGQGVEAMLAPDVSIIIVNWNLREFLKKCLESIRSRSDSLTVETIVVDNASDDGSIEMVEQDFPEVSTIINRENAGFARASNQGMKVARGRYIFLLNNDAVLPEEVLASLVEFMDAHPDTGICGPRVINSDGTLQINSKGFYPSIPRIAAQLILPGHIMHPGGRSLGLYEYKDDKKTREFDWLSGCALMARREAVGIVGLLDAEVFMYCEDIDWCYRMKKGGWKVVNLPQVNVLHYGGQSMKLQMGATVGSHAAGLIAFYKRYHSKFATAFFRTVVLAGYAIQAIGWILAAIFGRREGLDKLRRLFSTGMGRLTK